VESKDGLSLKKLLSQSQSRGEGWREKRGQLFSDPR